MKNTSKNSRVRVPTIFIMLIILGAAWGAYRFYPKSNPTIFVVDAPTTLEYGEVTLTGTLQKDTIPERNGTYILVTADGTVVILAVPYADALLGELVTVSGTLEPARDNSAYPIMSAITEISTVAEGQ